MISEVPPEILQKREPNKFKGLEPEWANPQK